MQTTFIYACPNTHRSLYPNPIDCTSDSTTALLRLARAGLIADISSLRCSNGTLIRDLEYDITTTSVSIATSTPYITTQTSTVSITPTSASSQSSKVGISVTSREIPYSSSSGAEPTPTAMEFCPSETTLTSSGYSDWPRSPSATLVQLQCPSAGGVVYRVCMATGMWGSANDSLCEEGSPVVRLLATITQVRI